MKKLPLLTNDRKTNETIKSNTMDNNTMLTGKLYGLSLKLKVNRQRNF
ncbi:hypothetical protein RFF58_01730 [Streptococcus ruminantium]|nr:hypothetical protein [Streptococcus ruminantium]MDQ8819809.1 hypothetical protein [Streptococcus ruminantium]